MQTVLHFHPHQSKTVYENLCRYVWDTAKFTCMQNLKCTKTCTFVLAIVSCFRASFEKYQAESRRRKSNPFPNTVLIEGDAS